MLTFWDIRGKIWPLLVTLKIEPFILIFFSSLNLSDVASTQLIQDKICLFKYNQSIAYCAQLSDKNSVSGGDSYKNEILADLAQYSIYRTVIGSLPSLLFSIFMGSWIDNYIHGRKILLCLGTSGYALQFGILLLNTIKFDLGVYYILIAYIPSALTGSWVCILLSSYSYVSYNSQPKYRIIKFALLEISLFSAGPIGIYIGGQLLGKANINSSNGQIYNYVTVFTASVVGLIISLIWILIMINEKKSAENENSHLINSSNKEEPEIDYEKSEERTHVSRSDDKFKILKMFDIENVKEVIRTCFKLRPNKGRAQIWLLYLSMCILMISDTKNSPVLFPYTEEVFDWDAEQFSTIKSIASTLTIISITIIVPLLSGFFKMKDTILGLIGLISMFLSGLLLGTIVSPIGLYISYSIGSTSAIASLGIRSLISKIVTEAEIGKVFSLLAALETVVPTLSSVFYSILFEYTIDFYPSLCFQIAASLLFIPMFIFIWIDMTRI